MLVPPAVANPPNLKKCDNGIQRNGPSSSHQVQTRRTGIIPTVHRDGRFGFITPSDGAKPIFVHCNKICADRNLFHAGSKVECTVVFDPRKENDKAVQVVILNPTDEKNTKTVNYAMVKQTGIVSETHRGGSCEFIEIVEGGDFIFVHSSACHPQEPKILGVGTRNEYEERFDARRSKLRAWNVCVRANPGASGESSRRN